MTPRKTSRSVRDRSSWHRFITSCPEHKIMIVVSPPAPLAPRRASRALVLSVAIGGWLGSAGVASAQGGPNAPPPPVTVAKPVVKEIQETDDFIGRFDAVGSVEIRARVQGYLDRVHFTDGAMIKAGDLL